MSTGLPYRIQALASRDALALDASSSSRLRSSRSFVTDFLCVVQQDTTAPLAADFGQTSVGIYAGSATSQFLVQDLGTVADPSKTLALKVTVDGTAGPDSEY